MAVKLRLTRVGSKKNPIYRVVAADSRSPRDGKFIEIIGRYNPQHEPSLIEVDEEKAKNDQFTPCCSRSGSPPSPSPATRSGSRSRAARRARLAPRPSLCLLLLCAGLERVAHADRESLGILARGNCA